MATKNIYQKLEEARKIIRETSLEKEGTNSFSNYDYFTPSQVSHLVSDASYQAGVLVVYNLEVIEGNYIGKLTVYNIEAPNERIEFTQPTAVAEIKATNAAQKIGGSTTYNERYLKMSAFEIVDNNLDPDSQDNRVTPPKKQTGAKVGEKQKMLSAISGAEILKLFKAGKITDIKKYLDENNYKYTPAQLAKFKK